MNKIIKASGNEVEPYWPGLFAKALEGQDIASLLTNVGSGAPAAGGAAAAGGDAGGAAEPEKKEESKSIGRTDSFPPSFCDTTFNAFSLSDRARRARGGRQHGRPFRRRRRVLSVVKHEQSDVYGFLRLGERSEESIDAHGVQRAKLVELWRCLLCE